uniref:Uncharacterized protein n=1 Tax=Candidozyma auris TaxID=498019 RepID=A0A0L0P8Z7_CANAR
MRGPGKAGACARNPEKMATAQERDWRIWKKSTPLEVYFFVFSFFFILVRGILLVQGGFLASWKIPRD